MKTKESLLVLSAIALVFALVFAACSNGTTGGGPTVVPTPKTPQIATYVSYDTDGNKIESITLTHTKSGTTVTVTVSDGGENSDKGTIISFTVQNDSEAATIPVDSGDIPVPIPAALPYILNEDGTGYIIIAGESLITNGVATIPDKAVDGKPVVAIGYHAFYNNKDLRSIEIPASIKSIGDWGNFEDCTNLTTVTFTTGSQLKTIGGGAFKNCTNLSAITIPASVKYIDMHAFASCKNLTSITIPASVTFIDRRAFHLWTVSQTINIHGHANQASADAAWPRDDNYGENWRSGCEAKINYNG